jgi:prolyl oligopeptidase
VNKIHPSGTPPACRFITILLALWLGVLTGCRDDSASGRPLIREYHGVKVTDEDQWLENGADPAVRTWSSNQNWQARQYLDRLRARPFIHEQVKRLVARTSPNYSRLAWRAGHFFLLKHEPPAQQPVLITLNDKLELKSEKVVLDPNALATNGSVSIDWFVPSSDGKLVAVSLSENGSESGSLYIYESATGRKQRDLVPRVQYPTAGGSAAWNSDGTGIFYTRYPAKGERDAADLHFYQQVYFHRLGTPASEDTYEFGKDWPRIAEIDLQSSPDGQHLLASVADGDGGEHAHFLRNTSGEWIQITRFEDRVQQVEIARDPLYVELGRANSLYLLSTRDAPKGKILRVRLADPDIGAAATVIKEGTNAIQYFKPTASGLALIYSKGGPQQLIYKDFYNPALSGPSSRSDRPDFKIPTAVREMLVTRGDEVLFRTETYTAPFTWWRYDTNKDRDKADATPLRARSPVPFTDLEAVSVRVASKDGTEIPMTIVRRKGTRLTGDNPTLLTGYGGFGISRTPRFDLTSRVWLDQGGVVAVANLRGGGEFGEEWHLAGNLTRKQNVFDDFAACAEWLVRSNYTNPGRLAIEGGSNGGLLMGATLTQQPTLARAVVSHVGIYDMLRLENDPNGAFNVTEYGSVQNPEQFKALHAYSPYHRVRDNTPYPAVLMLTGEHDGRVNPAHSRKMAARLQRATASKHPVLLRTSSTSGHGIGTSLNERVEQLADVYAFLMEQLGVDFSVVERGPWSGGVTPVSAIVKAKLPREGMRAQLVVSRNALLTSPVRLPAVTSQTNRNNVVAFTVANLQPDTQYYYALEVDGRLDRRKRGEFRTFPAPGPASFTIAFASCGRTGSTRDVYDRIREHKPLFYMNMGDFHYQDIRSNRPDLFRAAYDAVLASPQQGDLYRSVPLVYMWDDHDYGGNNSHGKAESHEAARRIYDEYVPHYAFAAPDLDDPIYQAFTVGRVKFIITDLRSHRDDPKDKDDENKSLLGPKQKRWFKEQLLEANGRYPLICWMTSVPWIGERGRSPYRRITTNDWGFIHHTNLLARRSESTNASNRSRSNRDRDAGSDEEHWSAFSTERREIANFIKANDIKGVVILHGDSHMLAADDGSNADYATGGGAPIPVLCGGPLDQNPSLKGGPYSQGVYRVRDKEGESGFGLMQVNDRGTHLEVVYSGRNNKDEEKISLRFTVAANARAQTRTN